MSWVGVGLKAGIGHKSGMAVTWPFPEHGGPDQLHNMQLTRPPQLLAEQQAKSCLRSTPNFPGAALQVWRFTAGPGTGSLCQSCWQRAHEPFLKTNGFLHQRDLVLLAVVVFGLSRYQVSLVAMQADIGGCKQHSVNWCSALPARNGCSYHMLPIDGRSCSYSSKSVCCGCAAV